MTRGPRHVVVGLALLAGIQLLVFPAGAQIPAAGLLSSHEMELETNRPNLVGNSLDFFERRLPDGTIKRYAVAATHVNGFDILDLSNPLNPTVVGRFVTPGSNYHPWVQVNGPRNIVALSIEDPAGATVSHTGSTGIEFVDISDVTNPTRLGVVDGLVGPHTIRMIGPDHIYTSNPTFIIDYSSFPIGAEDVKQSAICGHEFSPDTNNPGRTYVGICGAVGKWGILDTTDPWNPVLLHQEFDNKLEYAHEVYPAPDSSFVAVADFRGGGQTWVKCPGGALHFYDISGKYKPGASLTNPEKMGVWHIPFTGTLPVDPSAQNAALPNWGSCTLHSFQFQPERLLITAGLYSAGTWVMDPSGPTATGGDYDEYPGSTTLPFGPTTWGNTKGNFLAEGDFVNASQWLPFDVPPSKDHVYTNGLVRGLDVLHYHGTPPKKLSRLRIAASATGGVVGGILDRYAVLTYEGWVNKPLAGMTVEIRSGGTTVTATTGADGSFSANLGLAAGSHQVTVTWVGNEDFEVSSLSRQVTV
ncbi:MAG: hypothetical protein ACRDH9_03260 [Actinomycetota bacterium]